jgi:hypothetical protein
MKNVKIEVEGSELVLKNSSGDYVIIPKNKRNLVKRLMKEECYGCIDSVVDKLPVMSAYAEDGSIITEDDIKKKKDNIRTKLKVAVPIKKDQPIKDVSNIDEIFKQEESDRKTKQDVIDKKRARFNYENPEHRKGISSGNKNIDRLYNNQWLFDVPIVKDLIKNKAREMVDRSQGEATINNQNLERESGDGAYKGTFNRRGESKFKTERASLVDQYFSEKPLLKESPHKPKSDYLEFLPSYSLKTEDSENHIINNEDGKGQFQQALKEIFMDGDREDEFFKEDLFGSEGTFKDQERFKKFLKSKKPVFETALDGSELSKLLDADLGGHKIGAGWDEEKKLPYISVSDAWDFSPEHYAKKWGGGSGDPSYDEAVESLSKDYAEIYEISVEEAKNKYSKEIEKEAKHQSKFVGAKRDQAFIQATLLQKAGKPFKIYDRFYFDPNTGEYIPDEKTKK